MLTLEVIHIPVADVDRALQFYSENVGFSLDVDYQPNPGFRIAQLTPPGSACSIHLVASESKHRLQGLYLVTDDLVAECARLVRSGVEVSEIRRKDAVETWAGGFAPGVDPDHRNYASFADFTDPDGNVWTLQERNFQA